jgi:membrane protein DedA with SNARE-associated domain
MDPVAAFGAFLAESGVWAAPAFGLLAFGESIAVLGIVIPATPILFLMGTLVGSGRVDAVPVLGWAMAGAVAGYWLSWVAGRRIGHRLYQARGLRAHRRGVARARLFFRRWGGPALVFGRYLLGPFQSMLPLVAGVSRMDPHRFHPWNVVSGVTWVLVCLAPGYFTARGLWLAGDDGRWVARLTAGLALLSVGLIVAAFGGVAWRLLSGPRPSRREPARPGPLRRQP